MIKFFKFFEYKSYEKLIKCKIGLKLGTFPVLFSP